MQVSASRGLMLLLTLVLPIFGESAFSHARWLPGGPLALRDTNAGIKTGPCGPAVRSATPTVLDGGKMLRVDWEETVQHPGSYIISFSAANDANFQKIVEIRDTQDSRDDLPHRYSTEILIPNVACEACTLQLIQVMTENPANPRNYYSCADIKINFDPAAPTPPPAPTATPKPTPGNADDDQDEDEASDNAEVEEDPKQSSGSPKSSKSASGDDEDDCHVEDE